MSWSWVRRGGPVSVIAVEGLGAQGIRYRPLLESLFFVRRLPEHHCDQNGLVLKITDPALQALKSEQFGFQEELWGSC